MALLTILTALGYSQSAQAQTFKADIFWQTSGQCWQTGTLGAEAFECDNATAPEYLNSHMIDNETGVEPFKVAQPGQYCSYTGLDTLDRPEEAPVFTAGEPAAHQIGDGHGNVCAAWAHSGEPEQWGVQTHNDPPEGFECALTTPGQRCGMERYFSLATPEAVKTLKGLNDWPWASYLEGTRFIDTAAFRLYNPAEILAWEQGGAPSGAGWGYVCPVVEDRTSGDILELCDEQWYGPAREHENDEPEWEGRTFVSECKTDPAGLGHNVDRIVSDGSEVLLNGFNEPPEISSPFNVNWLGVGFSAAGMQQYSELDDLPFKFKTSHGGRSSQPELGSGCGRSSSTKATEWALIGVANGVESWEVDKTAGRLPPTTAFTEFEAREAEVSSQAASEITATEAKVTGDVNPNGFETTWNVQYGPLNVETYATPEANLGATRLKPTPVAGTLTGLSSGTTYYYRIKTTHTFNVNGTKERQISYGPLETFTTAVPQCAGANLFAAGSSLQALAQDNVWTGDFNSAADKSLYACNGKDGSGGTPKVSYEATGSGAGYGKWEEKHEYSKYGLIGTDAPVSGGEQAKVEEQRTEPTLPGKIMSIPVLQGAIAVVVHLPSGCTATSGPAPGRLVLNNKTLEGIYAGTITEWSEISSAENGEDEIVGEKCNTHSKISVIVRKDRSGTSHILKRYLNLLVAGASEMENGEMKTWGEVAEDGAENLLWPRAAHVIHAKEELDAGLLTEVAATPGSIGYASLAGTREKHSFVPPEGGEGKATFWVELENESSTSKGKTTRKFKDPASNGDVAAKASANCADTVYQNGTKVFPPPLVTEPWNDVAAEVRSKTYSLCGLTYEMALSDYEAYGGTAKETGTARDYLNYLLDKKGGQADVATHDYLALPEEILIESQRAIAGMEGAEGHTG